MRLLRVPQCTVERYMAGIVQKELQMPARYAPVLFGFILSALMSLLVSGIATGRNFGFVDGFAGLWIGAWLPSWLIAFPVVLVVAPVARRLVGMVVKTPATAGR
jgi:uncharacterized protein DUF2798